MRSYIVWYRYPRNARRFELDARMYPSHTQAKNARKRLMRRGCIVLISKETKA